jgi:hypothetical protein
MELGDELDVVHDIDSQSGIVILREQHRIGRFQTVERLQWRHIKSVGHLQIVIVQILMSGDVGMVLIEIEEGMNEVSLAVLEHVGGNMPFLHDELMGNIETFENQVEDINVIACRLALAVEELERTEIPVADDDQRVFVGIFWELVGSRESQRQTKQEG